MSIPATQPNMATPIADTSLRESFRQNGKVKHRTLANLSHCTEEEIIALKLALKHKRNLSELISLEEAVQARNLKAF